MANNIRNMWLHDEDNTYTVAPYTTLDNIKIESGGTYLSFKDDYDNTKETINTNKQISDDSFDAVNNRIDQIVISTEPATTTSNGLMSKEDKVKVDGVEPGANNYRLPLATDTSLGGVKVDGTTIELDVNDCLQVVQGGINSPSLESLSNVDVNDLADGQILAYDAYNEEWKNINCPGGSGVQYLYALNDVDINNLSDKQILQYDITTQRWINIGFSEMESEDIAALFEEN